jgi:hypothetical protein
MNASIVPKLLAGISASCRTHAYANQRNLTGTALPQLTTVISNTPMADTFFPAPPPLVAVTYYFCSVKSAVPFLRRSLPRRWKVNLGTENLSTWPPHLPGAGSGRIIREARR